MYQYVFGITIFDMLKPYLRRHVLQKVENHEFLFMNTFVILLITCCYFIYEYLFDNKFLHKTMANCCSLTYTQVAALFIVSLLTVCSTLMLLQFDKIHNTPSVNTIILKSFSLVFLFLVGVMMFREQYTTKKIIGIVITIIGILILTT
jgi:drug/metabolite transporter (DMT)-like permease